MRNKIAIGVLGLILLGLFWQDWSEGNRIDAVYDQWLESKTNINRLEAQQQQLTGVLVELIRRTGHTNMIQTRP